MRKISGGEEVSVKLTVNLAISRLTDGMDDSC